MKRATDPKAFDRALRQYCDMMAAGKGAKVALEATGLSHAQADLAWYGDPRNPNHVERGCVPLPLPDSKADGYEVALRRAGLVVAQLRSGEHPKAKGERMSWGQIAVMVGKPAATVERYFTFATGLSPDGMRKGKGGRFLAGEPRYYVGNRKGIGVEHERPRSLDPNKVAKEADTATSILPTTTKRLATQLRGKAKQRARKATAAKKAAAQKATATSE
jgi:hypothetical protein